MKTFYRTSLPDNIKYNGEIFKPDYTIQTYNRNPENIISKIKSSGKKAILVKVLSRKLKGKLDLHNKPYKPTIWIFVN